MYMPKSAVKEKKTVGGFAQNVLKSGGRFIEDIRSALLHPIETGKSLYNVGAGVAEKFTPGVQKHEKYANAIGNFYKQRYGGVKNIGNSLYYDPVGVAGDVSAVFGAGAGLLKGAAGIASKGATATKLSSATAKIGKAGSTLSKIERATDPLQAIGRAGKLAAKPVSKAVKKFTVPKSKDFVIRGLGNPSSRKKMIVPAEELIPKYNLWDRTPESAQKALDTLSDKRELAIQQSGEFGDLKDLLKPLDDEILSTKNNPNLFRGETPLSQEANQRLTQLVENRKNIVMRFAETGEDSTNLNPKISVANIDAFKRENIRPNVPTKARQSFSDSPGKGQAFKQTESALIKAVDDTAGTKQMSRDMQGLVELKKKTFPSYQARQKGNQMFNFTKLGSAGLGSVVGGTPGAVAGFAVEQFINSPKGMEIMYKTLKGIESQPFNKLLTKPQAITKLTTALKKAGIPKASTVARQMYNFAKAGRLVK